MLIFDRWYPALHLFPQFLSVDLKDFVFKSKVSFFKYSFCLFWMLDWKCFHSAICSFTPETQAKPAGPPLVFGKLAAHSVGINTFDFTQMKFCFIPVQLIYMIMQIFLLIQNLYHHF